MSATDGSANRAYESGSTMWVGSFFETLSQRLFGGEKPTDGEGDLVLWDDGIGLEVKGSDTRHRHRLATEQLDYYLRISAGFPLDHHYYLLFGYRNPSRLNGDGRVHTLLSQNSRDQADVWQFLATQTASLHALDVRVVDAIRRRYGTRRNSIPCHPGYETVDVSRDLLRSLAEEDSAAALARDLGLANGRFKLERRAVRHDMRIECPAGLQLALDPEFERPSWYDRTIVIETRLFGTPEGNAKLLRMPWAKL